MDCQGIVRLEEVEWLGWLVGLIQTERKLGILRGRLETDILERAPASPSHLEIVFFHFSCCYLMYRTAP